MSVGRLIPILLLMTAPLHAQREVGEVVDHIKFLASDDLRGRGNYDPEIQIAADYIADLFRRYGLEPAGEDGYFQSFALPPVAAVDVASYLSVRRRGRIVRSGASDLSVVGYGDVNRFRSQAVFAGYGITAPERGYDDYSSVDVEGKTVLLLENEPVGFSYRNRRETLEPTPYSTIYYKVANARAQGAAAVILLPDEFNRRQGHLFPEGDSTPPERLGIPVLRADSYWVRGLYALVDDRNRFFRVGDGFWQAQRWIHQRLQPVSFEIDDLEVEMGLEIVELTGEGRNVLGFLPGLSDELTIVGAHYDHIGLGDDRFNPERLGEIHNGADDNASGTAGLLTLARRLSRGPPLNRGLLFIAFAGEEVGLLGSRHFVRNPTVDRSQIVGMLNLDMIGRSLGDLYINGAGTAQEFNRLLDGAQRRTSLRLLTAQTPQAPSDHMPFSDLGLPVLFFSSGKHSQYHRPEDDWYNLHFVRLMEIIDLVGWMVGQIDRAPERLSFVDLRGTAAVSGASPLPVLGMRPDQYRESRGVRVDALPEDSPALRAGVQEGDLLIGLDDVRIDGYSGLLNELAQKAPGDIVQVTLFRRGEIVTLPVPLGTR